MKTKKPIPKINSGGLALGVLMAAALLQCESMATAQSVTVSVPVPAPTVNVVAQDDYVYYPHYGMYYNRFRHRFYYENNGAWVVAEAPVGVTADVVLASPSVHMDFRDLPEHHHADILKRYPRDWAPPAGDRHDHDSDHHDKH